MQRPARRNGKRAHEEEMQSSQKRWLAKAFPDSKPSCIKLLDSLRAHREAGPFNAPVDPIALGCPDYPLKIKHPMDFATIAYNLQNDKYRDSREFQKDMKLVFQNCWTYNQEGSPIYSMASNLNRLFEESFANVELLESKTLYEAELEDMKQTIDKLKTEHETLQAELTKLQNGETTTTTRPAAVTNGEPLKKKPKKKKRTSIGIKQKEQLGRKIEQLSYPSIQKLIQQFPLQAAVRNGELEIDLNLNMAAFKSLSSFVDKCYKEQKDANEAGGAIDPSSTSSLEAKDDSSSDSDSSSSDSDSSDSDSEKELAVKAQE